MLTQRFAGLDRDVKRHLINSATYAITLDGGIATVIFNLYLLRLGYDAGFIGLISAIGQIVFALACIPVGRLGERFGLLSMMRGGIALTVLGGILVPLAGWFPEGLRLPTLLLAAVLNNIGLAGYFVSAAPYFSMLCTHEQRTNVFSLQAAMYASFGFVGGLLGGYIPTLFQTLGLGDLATPSPYIWTLWLVPVFLIFPMLLSLRMRHSETARVNSDEMLTTGTAPIVAGMFGLIFFFGLLRFLQVGGISVLQTFFNVYMDSTLGVDLATLGLIQAFSKLGGVPMALAIPWLTKRFGVLRTCVVAMTVAGLAILPLGWFNNVGVATIGYWLLFLMTPVRYAAFMLFTMSRVPARLHGTLNGIQEALAGVGFAVTALVGGMLIQSSGSYGPTFTLGALFVLLGVVLLAIYAWRTRAARG